MFEKKIKNVCYWFGCWACRVFFMLFFRVQVQGRDNVPEKGGVLLACNHQSYLDPMLCGIPLKRQLWYMAKDALFKHWLAGRILRSVKAIPVNREQPELSTIKTIIAKLKDGDAVCLFPESTRTLDGRIADLKPGFGLICRRGQAAVVPVVVDGPFERWPRHQKLFSCGRVFVCYGKAIGYDKIKGLNDEELTRMLTEKLREMQNECRLSQGKEPYNYDHSEKVGTLDKNGIEQVKETV